MTEKKNAEQVGLVAVKLSEPSTPVRDLLIESLRAGGFTDLEWENDLVVARRAPEVGPHDAILEAALRVRDAVASLGTSIGIACDAAEDDAQSMTLALARTRTVRRAVDAPSGTLVIGRPFYSGLRRTAGLSFEPLPGLEARYRVSRGTSTMALPARGRWLMPRAASRPVVPPEAIDRGFLDLDKVPGRRDLAEVVADGAHAGGTVLILAEAAFGKTHCASWLHDHLLRSRHRVHYTDFESTSHSQWPSERFVRAVGPRTWIVNAADEADRKGYDLREIAERRADTQQLTTIVFCRPDEAMDQLVSAFREQGFASYALLPLDAASAAAELNLEPAAFEKLRANAASIARLQVAFTFPELKALAEASREMPDLAALRHELLLQKCAHRRGRTPPTPLPSPEKLLEVASRLAAISIISGDKHLFHFGEDGAEGFDVRRVMSESDCAVAMRLEETSLVEVRGGSRRFALSHLEEDLAASAFKRERPLPAPVLRNLLHDGLRVRADLARVADLVGETVPGAKQVLDAPLDPKRALEILDAVLTSVGQVPAWLDDQDVLSVLGAPEVEKAACERLGKPLPAGQVHVLLELALRHGWADAAPSAEQIACDASMSPEVRSTAVHVALLATGDAPATLIALMESIPVDETDDDLANLRATIVSHRLRWGALQPVAAAAMAGRAKPRRHDSRSVLLTQIAEAIDLSLGREIIDQLRGSTPCTIAARDELGVPAARRVLSAERFEQEDLDRLLFIVSVRDRFATSLFDDVRARLARDRDARRALYEALDLRGTRQVFLDVQEDAAWLVERLKQPPAFPDALASDLFLAAKHLLSKGDALGEIGKQLLQARGLWDAMEERFQRPAPWVQEHQEAQRKRREKRLREMLPLEDVIERLLTDKRGPTTQVHLLGDFVWGDRLNGRNVVGSFDDLSDEVQKRILDTAAHALTHATPTPLPEGREYSSHLIEEGEVFQRAALADDAWLTPDQVKRWLGATLATWTSSTKRIGDLIETCFTKAPKETRDAVIVELDRRAKDGYAPLDVVPRRMRWDGAFQEAVADFVRRAVRGPERSLDAAMDALAFLLDAAEGGVPPAAGALVTELVRAPERELRWRALGVWFAHRPNDALAQVLSEATDEASVRAIFAPAAERRDLRRTGGTWSLEVIGPAAVRLATHVPRTEHDRPDGVVRPHHMLAELRDHLIGRVFHAAVREPERAAPYSDAICGLPKYQNWASYSAARETLRITLEKLRHPRPTPIQIAELLRGKLAVVHDARDLAEWVVAVLATDRDPTDSSLLYDDRPDGTGRYPRRLESSVHALLRKDLVAGLGALGLPNVRVWREPLEHASKEPDFVISVSDIDVPIEVKWSVNDLLKGLHDQLGRRYVGEHAPRSHGVYFVAWCGESSLAKTRDELQARLELEAKKLRETMAVVAHIVVADLRHPKER